MWLMHGTSESLGNAVATSNFIYDLYDDFLTMIDLHFIDMLKLGTLHTSLVHGLVLS
jgi:hypothetical protein